MLTFECRGWVGGCFFIHEILDGYGFGSRDFYYMG